MIWIRLTLLAFALCFVYYAAKKRAPVEARKIADSDKELGLLWHVKMWLTGKAGAGLIAVLPFAFTFQHWHILYAAVAIGLTSMVWYSYVFDQVLSLARGYDRWYISFDQHTALTDKLLREVMWRTEWTPEQTHKRVKLPLLFLGLLGCVVVAFL